MLAAFKFPVLTTLGPRDSCFVGPLLYRQQTLLTETSLSAKCQQQTFRFIHCADRCEAKLGPQLVWMRSSSGTPATFQPDHPPGAVHRTARDFFRMDGQVSARSGQLGATRPVPAIIVIGTINTMD